MGQQVLTGWQAGAAQQGLLPPLLASSDLCMLLARAHHASCSVLLLLFQQRLPAYKMTCTGAIHCDQQQKIRTSPYPVRVACSCALHTPAHLVAVELLLEGLIMRAPT
jgi:hypothetical protein